MFSGKGNAVGTNAVFINSPCGQLRGVGFVAYLLKGRTHGFFQLCNVEHGFKFNDISQIPLSVNRFKQDMLEDAISVYISVA